nr:MAG TPA: hypothetical protein [Caudoviricetes sp.]DAS14076.1 MAG TPA: hypothetical protein [Caudoviricetes sp.]
MILFIPRRPLFRDHERAHCQGCEARRSRLPLIMKARE